jgi:hypothetical protein
LRSNDSWWFDSARSQLPPLRSAAAVPNTYPRTVTQSEREIRMELTVPAGAPPATPLVLRFTTAPTVMTMERDGRVTRAETTVMWEADAVVRANSMITDGLPQSGSRDILRLEEDGRVMTYTTEIALPNASPRVYGRWVYVRGD